MRRTITYIGAWVAAGATAVILASIGVSMVGHQVTAPHPSPLSAGEVRAELAGPGATTSTTSGTPDATAATSTSTSSPTTVGAAPTGAAPVTTRPAPPGGASDVGAPAATQPAAETRSYTLVGGSVTLRFASTGVKVVVATPNPGYAVEVSATHENGVRVELRGDEHRSQVEGWWDDGPQDEVDEED